jgi:hypothetical protein
MLDVDVKGVIKRLELQLGGFERTLEESKIRIDNIERHLAVKIKQVREYIDLMVCNKDVMMITKIVDVLSDIERIVDKLNSLDITFTDEISLEGLMEEEFEKIESFVF